LVSGTEARASIIAASHTTELAEKWGRRVRNLVTENGSLLQLALSSDSQAAGRWALTSGGEYYAAGVGVGIAGFRADLAVIDDPVRSREDADSQAVGERWHVLSLPAEAEPDDPLGRQPGELLWDDEYGYARFLEREKATQLPRNWSALYQQTKTMKIPRCFQHPRPHHQPP
jgi:hypothetical protein